MVTRGPGPSLPVPAASTRMEISLSSCQQLADAFGDPALQDDQFGHDAGQLIHRLGGGMEQRFGLGMGFVLHDRFHPAPLLEIGRRGGAEQGDAAAGMLGAARGKTQRHLAFGRLVDHHQEFADAGLGGQSS